MPTRTPIPVSRAMRQISANLDLARRQQRIPVALLAERAGLSMPTVTKMLRTGNGRALRTSSALLVCLDCWTAYSKRRTLLTQISANYAPTKTLRNVFDSTAGGATHHGSNRHPAVQRHRRHRREIIHQYQARHRIGKFHIRYGLYALFKRSIPLSRDAPPPERSRPSIMRCIASFKTACRIVGAGTSCFVQNIKMLVRSIAQHAHYLREISCYPSTMRPDKAHCASGTTTVTR